MKKIGKFIVLAILAGSCSGKVLEPVSEIVDVDGAVLHEMIVLGNKLEDPYSVENMTKALDALYPTKAARAGAPLTDYYVRFLPADESQFEALEKLGLNLIDHPVDYEILQEGDYYHDPDIEEGKITWQYTVVDKDFKFPEGIRYEILDRCCLAENDSQTKADGIDWAAVEMEAYRLTGNGALVQPGTKADKSIPSGRITIIDDKKDLTPEGVRGVKVSVNSFVKFDNAFTDENGYYQMRKSYSSKVRYRLVFKNKKGFAIGFNLLLVPASVSTLGKSSPSGMDVTIDSDSERKLFTRAVVNNAGYDYYEGCADKEVSIKTPPTNLRLWLFQKLGASSAPMLQHGAFIDNSIIGDYLGEYTLLLKLFLPDVTLGLKGLTAYDEVYASAVHEMAHASHFMQVGKDYWDKYIGFILKSFVTSGFVTYGAGTEDNHGYCEVGEMWAYYMQTQMYRDRYGTDKVFGTSFWFHPEIFLTIDAKGIDRYNIFNALTSDITDRDILQKKLVNLNPKNKSAINQAFGIYN